MGCNPHIENHWLRPRKYLGGKELSQLKQLDRETNILSFSLLHIQIYSEVENEHLQSGQHEH